MSNARDAILRRIRAALPTAAGDIAASYAGIRREYHRTASLSPAEVVEHFVDRLADYDADIFQTEDAADIPEATAQALAMRKETTLLAAPEFPREWLPNSVDVVIDPLAQDGIAAHAAVITTCELAIASTGTIVLVHRGAQGRRILTLLPDHHICIVNRAQVVETVPQAIELLAASSRLPMTTISGPSATSDIEMTRIRGVHGPRRLSVVLFGEAWKGRSFSGAAHRCESDTRSPASRSAGPVIATAR